MRIILIYLLLIFIANWGYSQQLKKWQVLNKETNKPIPFAVCIINNQQLIADSNAVFIFSPKVTDTLFELKFQINSYEKQMFKYTSLDQIESIYYLQAKSKKLREIIIRGNNYKKNELGNMQLSQEQIEKLPTFLGENDIVKAIQLLPGIQSSGDGNGIYVRGGGIDQNLILYDEVSLYNVSHLFGFFSVFNSNAISKADIYKSGIPPNYGGRVSSVIAIQSQTGNFSKWKGELGVGLLATNVVVDGPIKKDTSSVLFAFRRTYVDYLNRLISANSNYQTDYYFYDFNFKYVHKFGKKNKILLSALNGKDEFVYNDRLNNTFSNNIKWQTQLTSLQWIFDASEHIQSKTILGYVNYSMIFGAGIYNYSLDLSSKINDFSFKNEWTIKHLKSAKLVVGSEIIKHQISPNNFSIQGESTDTKFDKSLKLNSIEYNIYLSEYIQFSDKWKLLAGIRYAMFQQIGPFQRLILSNNVVTDSINYLKNSTISFYHNPEPRFQLTYDYSDYTSFKLSYSTNYQYIHLSPVSSISLPTDVWVPTSSVIKPQLGRQVSLGYSSTFYKNELLFSTEVYYKKMENLIEYKEGVMSLVSMQSNYDDNFFFGTGQSYGIEFLIKKNVGKLTGWLGYTLSKATRKFPDIEDNRTFFAKNDRRHDISTVLNYDFNDRWSLSTVFVFKTGNAITIPLARYILQGNVINTYSPKNSYRIEPYHRMDIALNYQLKKSENYEQSLNFSVFNVYARQNPFYIYFETSGDLSKFAIQTKAKQVSLFTILPSISWKIVFK